MKKTDLKIALINATRNDWGSLEPPLGILSLASYLIHKKVIKKKNIVLLDVCLRDPVDYLEHFQPDMIGLSAMTSDYPGAVELAKRIRALFPQTTLVIGGVHLSVMPEELQSPFDAGVYGEGEETLFELVKVFKKRRQLTPDLLKGIKGVVYFSKNGKLIKNEPRPLIKPLDKIPPIDWSLLPSVYFRPKVIKMGEKWQVMRRAALFTSRGCPFHCVFCGRHAVWEGVRYFSPARVVNEMEVLSKKYHTRAIAIWDDTFTLNKARIKEIVRLMKKRGLAGKLAFPQTFARCDLVDEEFLSLLKEMGEVSLFYGFESGSERILQYLKRKTVTVAQNRRAAELTDQFGIGIIGGFIFGSPEETKGDMEQTLAFIKWLAEKKSYVRFEMSRATPYPGTELWQYAVSKKLLPKDFSWNLLKMCNPAYRPDQVFFKEKMTQKEFEEVWYQVREVRLATEKKLAKDKDYQKAMTALLRRDGFDHALLPLTLIWRDFVFGRYGLAGTRLLAKFKSHFFSPAKVREDLGKFKKVFANFG